jgi:hypothetical protein
MPVDLPVLGHGGDEIFAFEGRPERTSDGTRDRGELGQPARGLSGGAVSALWIVDGNGVTPDGAAGKVPLRRASCCIRA